MLKTKKVIETKLAEAQLRLARERDMPNPNVLKIDRFEREAAIWALQLKKIDEALAKMP